MPKPGQPSADGHLVTVRGLLIAIVTITTAGSAGIAAGAIAATKVAGSTITPVIAITAGLAATVTTALAVASGLHKLIRRE
jgi:hypothetical protein